MSKHACFMIEDTGIARQFLRRYVSSLKASCPLAFGYHNALVPFDMAPAKLEASDAGHLRYVVMDDGAPPHDDVRWPTACACGHAFADDDGWQLFSKTLFRRQDTGEEMTLDDAPPGAMWRAEWMEPKWVGPDGICLAVKTPGGIWTIDGPSSNAAGTPWKRTGEAPRVTATPSILIGSPTRYHGFLVDGVLESTSDSPT